MSNEAVTPEPRNPEDVRSTVEANDPSVSQTPVEPESTVVPRKRSGALRETIETLLLALFIFVAVRQVVLNFRVDGQSMTPNLHNGQMLLVNRHSYAEYDLAEIVNWVPGINADDWTITPFGDVERGDIIVFNPPNDDKPYIKRIIGLPGDKISFQDGSVFVNDQQLGEPYIDPGITRCPTSSCQVPIIVPDGNVYVLGDNRGNSQDSRFFGPVDIDSIIGKAIVTYWPWNDIGRVPHYEYSGIPEAQAPTGD